MPLRKELIRLGVELMGLGMKSIGSRVISPEWPYPAPTPWAAAEGRASAQVGDGALPVARGPWPANRAARSSAIVAAPGTFIFAAVLIDW